MKKKYNYIMPAIGILSVLFGRILLRVLSEYFGYNNSAVIIMSVVLVSLLGIIIGLIAKGYYIGAIIFLVMFMPLLGIGIGAYLDNIKPLVDYIKKQKDFIDQNRNMF